MNLTSRLKIGMLVVVISFAAIGLVAGFSLLRAVTVEASLPGGLESQAFVGGAIVLGYSDPQKITCSTGGSKNTNGLHFSAHTRMGIMNGYWDIASPLRVLKTKVDIFMMEKLTARLTN
jgi:hypothetical protein